MHVATTGHPRAQRAAMQQPAADARPVAAHTRPSLVRGGAAYAFRGGFEQAHRGVKLLFEHVSPAQDRANAELVTSILDQVPRSITSRVKRVVVLAGQDVAYDRDVERQYGIPGFQAVAAAGRGTITFFGGRPYSVGTVFHELGHSLPVRSWRWNRAARADDATIQALHGRGALKPVPFEVVPDPERQARWTPRLAPGGVTPYGHGRRDEDIAESLRLLLLERRFGRAFATIEDTNGVRPLWFAQAYPERTRVLEQASGEDLDASDEVAGRR